MSEFMVEILFIIAAIIIILIFGIIIYRKVSSGSDRKNDWIDEVKGTVEPERMGMSEIGIPVRRNFQVPGTVKVFQDVGSGRYTVGIEVSDIKKLKLGNEVVVQGEEISSAIPENRPLIKPDSEKEDERLRNIEDTMERLVKSMESNGKEQTPKDERPPQRKITCKQCGIVRQTRYQGPKKDYVCAECKEGD